MSLSLVKGLISNSITYPVEKQYAAIIGEHPSKGARSPILWNSAFAANRLDATMLALDVSKDRFNDLISILDADPMFLGGAIAVPYKEMAALWLRKNVSPEAKYIGSVNCIYRGVDSKLFGTNTDGEAALLTYLSAHLNITDKTVLLLGPGGTGRSVAVFFKDALGSHGRLFVAGRTRKAKKFVEDIGGIWIDWQEKSKVLQQVDILINCTDIGGITKIEETPLTLNEMTILSNHVIVFDVIYQPKQTELLRIAANRGLTVFNGLQMNIEQAILAFDKVVKNQDIEVTRASMYNFS